MRAASFLPPRVQLSRKAGWRMPFGAVKVDRSTKWGNPFNWATMPNGKAEAKVLAVAQYRAWITGRSSTPDVPPPPSLTEIRSALRGRPLACWCSHAEPCHATVLLEVANA